MGKCKAVAVAEEPQKDQAKKMRAEYSPARDIVKVEEATSNKTLNSGYMIHRAADADETESVSRANDNEDVRDNEEDDENKDDDNDDDDADGDGEDEDDEDEDEDAASNAQQGYEAQEEGALQTS